MFALKPFQETAIAKLKDQFLSLWKSPHNNIPLIFKSPTGSGKTIMMAQFLRDLVGDPRFCGNDTAFIWLTFNEESYIQSKNKLLTYYGGASELDLIDLNDLTRGKLSKNSVFFINWQKIKGKSKESRKLRKDNEWGHTFDNFIKRTQAEGRELIVIIDEEHIGSDTALAQEIVSDLIQPKITIRVSATPKSLPDAEQIAEGRGGFVQAKREEVIEAGLIKEKIIFQTEEDLNRTDFKGVDQDDLLLELAFQKREEIIREYQSLGADINPLVLIQLPNDDQTGKDTSSTNKQSIVLNFLKEKGVPEEHIAIWLSQEKVNLSDIEKVNSPVSFLLFKQAAATGWDCPRAGVLVMYREIKNPTFTIQTVGRILRMPLGTHFPIPALNSGYLYTNYKRSEVLSEYSKNTTDNRPAIYGSYRKTDIEPTILESVFMSRTDYNDLGDTFQDTFAKVANDYFGISDTDTPAQALKKLESKKLATNIPVTNGLITDVEIDDYDNFKTELLTEGSSHDQEMSQHDLERLYNLLCHKQISGQIDENKKFAPERSWGKLKTALNVWLLSITKKNRQEIYRITVADLLSPTSTLAPLIGISLEKYRPIREKEVSKKSERNKRTELIKMPPDSLFFTDQYKEMKVKKSAMQPFYIESEYAGDDNENEFIKCLEASDVLWWHKNGDSGSEFFSIPYYNPDENKEKLFYPDWIFKTKTSLWVVDTKKGTTAEIPDTKYKAEALQLWLKDKPNLIGGIVVQDGTNGWKVNTSKIYKYTPSFDGWDNLKDVI